MRSEEGRKRGGKSEVFELPQGISGIINVVERSVLLRTGFY